MPLKILIVDDHRLMREGLRHMLRAQPDFQVVGEAGDTDTAWEAILRLQPDLVLMDIDLPAGGAIAMVRRVRAEQPTTRMLMVSGMVDPDLIQESLNAGASGYLFKINGRAELLAAITAVLAGKVYLCLDSTTALHRKSQQTPHPEAGLTALLTVREKQVLRLVVAGMRNKEVAVELGLGIKSVENYRSQLMKKMHCESPAELVRAAIRQGLAPL